MVTREKRSLKGALPPKQTRQLTQMQLSNPIQEPEEQVPLPPPPPKKERHFQKDSSHSTPQDNSDTVAEGSTTHHPTSAKEGEEEQDDDEDDDARNGRVAPQNAAVPKLKLRLSQKDDSPASPSPTKQRYSLLKKNPALAIARPYTPLQTDESSEDGEPAVPSRRTSLSPAKQDVAMRQVQPADSDTDFDLDMSEALFGHHLTGDDRVMITWTDNEEASLSDGSLRFQVEEQDLEELLAWGNGEVQLPGMPEVAGPDFWPQQGPFLELELDNSSSEDSDNASDDSSMDSAEEEEQMLAVRGLCAFGSDTEGETTDSIDDTDQDGLVRFGIEHSGSPIKRTKRPVLADEPKLPVMGSFKPVASTDSAVVGAVESGHAPPVASPFSAKRVRMLRRKAASESSPSRKRTDSIASSSQQSTQSAPSQIEQNSRASPSPISDIPEEEEEEVFMDLDLDDILESTALHAEFDLEVADSDEMELADLDGYAMPDLSRWDRVPIGAYRSSRSPMKAGEGAAMRQGAAGLSSAPMYFPVANLLSTRETVTLRVPWHLGRKRKITRQEAIGLSPILCPIRPVPSSMKSRKQKRADRKLAKKSHLVSPDKVEAGPSKSVAEDKTGTDVLDHEVPPLSLPGASEALPIINEPVPSPADLLPVPTLPSAECLPLDSPLFSAVRTKATPHVFIEP